MKKSIFAVLAIGAIAFVSCKKEEAATPAEPGTASISGTLWANTNLDNDTDDLGFWMLQPEYAKSGVTITATMDSEQLDQTPDPDFTYQVLSWTTTIGTNGSYSFTGIPCYNWPVDVELKFNDYTDTQLSGGTNSTKTFSMMGASQWVEVYAGAVVINQDWMYSYY